MAEQTGWDCDNCDYNCRIDKHPSGICPKCGTKMDPTRPATEADRKMLIELIQSGNRISPDEDGHCTRCGLEWEDPNGSIHECPPGFREN